MVWEFFQLNAQDMTRRIIADTEINNDLGHEPKTLCCTFSSKAEQNFADHQNEIALDQGQLTLGQINRLINEARTKEDMKAQRDEKTRKQTSDHLWRTLLAQLQNQVQIIDERIDGHRSYFESKYGENWLSTLGRSLLGEDMPERQSGETLDAYQERVEREIFDRICHSDGSLKDEYKSHPDAERLQQWGKDRTARAAVQAGIDAANTAPDEAAKIEALKAPLEDATVQEVWVISAGIERDDGSAVEREIESKRDKLYDHMANGVDAIEMDSGF